MGYMSQKLVRPTLLPMQRLPNEDRPGVLGLELAWRDLDGLRILQGVTLWAVIGHLDLSSPLALKWYRLTGDDERRVATVRPWRQRVKELDVEPRQIWSGYAEELEALRKEDSRRRARAKATPKAKAPSRALALVDRPSGQEVDDLQQGGIVFEEGGSSSDEDDRAEAFVFGDLPEDADGDFSDEEARSSSGDESNPQEPWAIEDADLQALALANREVEQAPRAEPAAQDRLVAPPLADVVPPRQGRER